MTKESVHVAVLLYISISKLRRVNNDMELNQKLNQKLNAMPVLLTRQDTETGTGMVLD